MTSMYRQNAAPPPPDPKEVARQAVKNCAMIQVGIAVLHVVTLSLIASRVGFFKLPANTGIPTELFNEWRTTALLAAVAYVVVFGAWAALNAWGLGKRSRVARWSSIAFAIATVVTCCSWPFGGFLLFMLLKKDVKAYFD
jgi:hypothetical protein